MKIIELFVKIANKEEVPKEIKWRGNIYEYSSIAAQYYIKDRIHNVDNSLRAALYDFSDLNNEIEIIEEDKRIAFEEIEELTCNSYDYKTITINYLIKNQKKLIDEVNKLKGEK